MSRTNGHEEIGLVGLGLMGRGIAACLVAHGFSVTAFDRLSGNGSRCGRHVESALRDMVSHGLLQRTAIRGWKRRFRAAKSLEELAECDFIVESVQEDLDEKKRVFRRLEKVVRPDAVIASNTSSLPITLLQRGRKRPARFVGMHWGEPAQILRYLEIIPGDRTSPDTIRRTEEIGKFCGKEPCVLGFDVRGFLSNRMMYAIMREACYLLEAGVADVETIDRSFRNDIGYWATIAGPFRWMDLTGIPAYATVMEGLLPNLSNMQKVPETMRKAVTGGAHGISNRKGFYRYTPGTARDWEKAWVEFTYDIRKIVDKYSRMVQL